MPDTIVSYFRAPIATSVDGEELRVDRDARRITNYAVATRGPAQGHGMWLDAGFLDQIVTAGNKRPLQVTQRGGFNGGVKMRFTHPGLSADGMGTQVGRATNFWRDGDVVRADAYFYREISSAKINDHIETILDLAEKDPAAFGSSIVFQRDPDAEAAFAKAHKDDAGEFVSPEAANEQNFPHARLAKLHASDVVDEPAANPGGFLSDNGELAARAETLLLYATGLSEREPDTLLLHGLPATKIREFLAGFLSRHRLALVQQEIADLQEDDEDDTVTCPKCGAQFVPAGMAAPAPPIEAGTPASGLTPEDAARLHELIGSAEEHTEQEEALRAISYTRAHPKGTPLAPKTDQWDGPGEVARAEVEELLVMCTWVETGAEDRKGAYKLPHHRAGSHTCVWRGVAAAAARLPMTNMPESDKASVRMHLGQHYREFDEEPPWDRHAAGWATYEALCGQLSERGDVEPVDLFTALRLCALYPEAESLYQADMMPIDTAPIPDALPEPGVGPSHPSAEDDPEQILRDPARLGALVGEVFNERLLAVTGRLPH